MEYLEIPKFIYNIFIPFIFKNFHLVLCKNDDNSCVVGVTFNLAYSYFKFILAYSYFKFIY